MLKSSRLKCFQTPSKLTWTNAVSTKEFKSRINFQRRVKTCLLRATRAHLLFLKREQSARKSRLGKDGLVCLLRLPVLSIHRRLKVCAPRQVAGSGVPPPPRRRPTDRRCASESHSVHSVSARLPAKVHRRESECRRLLSPPFSAQPQVSPPSTPRPPPPPDPKFSICVFFCIPGVVFRGRWRSSELV